MISVIDIFRAISETIRAKYPDIKIQNSDLKNPERPSFYINVVQEINDRVSPEFTKKKISFDVIYFTESNVKGYKDLLEKQSTLANLLLKPLQTIRDNKMFYFDVIQPTFNLNTADYVLNSLFDVEFTQLISEENIFDTNKNTETMDILEIEEN